MVVIRHFGLSAPAGLPPEITQPLTPTLRPSLAAPALQGRLPDQRVDLAYPELANPEGNSRFLLADPERSRRAVQLAGIKPEQRTRALPRHPPARYPVKRKTPSGSSSNLQG